LITNQATTTTAGTPRSHAAKYFILGTVRK
jgi:hypothetical protein